MNVWVNMVHTLEIHWFIKKVVFETIMISRALQVKKLNKLVNILTESLRLILGMQPSKILLTFMLNLAPK